MKPCAPAAEVGFAASLRLQVGAAHFEGAGLSSKRPVPVKAGNAKKAPDANICLYMRGKVCVGGCPNNLAFSHLRRWSTST